MKTITCPECKGSRGRILYEEWRDYSIRRVDTWIECSTCSGEGTIDVPMTAEDLDELGIPASADDLTDVDSSDTLERET